MILQNQYQWPGYAEWACPGFLLIPDCLRIAPTWLHLQIMRWNSLWWTVILVLCWFAAGLAMIVRWHPSLMVVVSWCQSCWSSLGALSSPSLPTEELCIWIPSGVLWSCPPPDMIHLWCTCYHHPADPRMHVIQERSTILSPLILLEVHLLWCCWSFALPHMRSSISLLLILFWMFCFLISASDGPLARSPQWFEVHDDHLPEISSWSTVMQLLSPPWVHWSSFFADSCGLLAHAHWRSSLMAMLLPKVGPDHSCWCRVVACPWWLAMVMLLCLLLLALMLMARLIAIAYDLSPAMWAGPWSSLLVGLVLSWLILASCSQAFTDSGCWFGSWALIRHCSALWLVKGSISLITSSLKMECPADLSLSLSVQPVFELIDLMLKLSLSTSSWCPLILTVFLPLSLSSGW